MQIFYEVIRRILCALTGVFMLLLAVTTFLAQLRLAPIPELEMGGLTLFVQESLSPVQSLVISGVWLVLGFLLLALSLTGLQRPKRSFNLQEHYASVPGIGKISVTEEGLQRMLARAGTEVEGISGLSPRLVLGPAGWDIECAVFVWNHASIPKLTDHLRRTVVQVMEMHTGLSIHRLDLQILHHTSEPGSQALR